MKTWKLICDLCGAKYDSLMRPELIPHYCGPCDKSEAKRLLRIEGVGRQRSESQKKREPY